MAAPGWDDVAQLQTAKKNAPDFVTLILLVCEHRSPSA